MLNNCQISSRKMTFANGMSELQLCDRSNLRVTLTLLCQRNNKGINCIQYKLDSNCCYNKPDDP